MRLILRWFPSLFWAAFIFWLSSQSHPPGAEFELDWLGHFGMYGILSAALVWGVTDCFARPLKLGMLCLVVIASTLYGFSDEFHQSFVPERTVSGRDILTNFLGALLAAFFLFLLLKRTRWKAE